MTIETAVDLLTQLLTMTLTLLGPLLGTAMVVGVAVSLAQTVTSIQEPTLTFVPKLVAMGVVVIVSAGWMLQTMMEFCIHCIERMATIAS